MGRHETTGTWDLTCLHLRMTVVVTVYLRSSQFKALCNAATVIGAYRHLIIKKKLKVRNPENEFLIKTHTYSRACESNRHTDIFILINGASTLVNSG